MDFKFLPSKLLSAEETGQLNCDRSLRESSAGRRLLVHCQNLYRFIFFAFFNEEMVDFYEWSRLAENRFMITSCFSTVRHSVSVCSGEVGWGIVAHAASLSFVEVNKKR